jgi:periplasmic divalent cation tolerance protein
VPINSRYEWKGERTTEPELMMMIKTRTALFEAVMARLLEEHPYELAEITATPFAAGSPAYLEWINENTKAETETG